MTAASCIGNMSMVSDVPRGPRGEKRPADVIGNAVKVMRIATGEEQEETDSPKSAAAEFGSRGGKVRAERITPARRAEIAKNASLSRWKKAIPAVREKKEPV
jgi:hypothetical protein